MTGQTSRAQDEKGDQAGRRRLGDLKRAVLRNGKLALILLDTGRIVLSFVVVLILRFDGAVPADHWSRLRWFLPAAVAAHLLANWRFRVYEQVWRHASLDEAIRVAGASGLSLVIMLFVDLTQHRRVPVSVVVFGGVLAMLLTGVSRFQSRLLAALQRTRRRHDGTRIAIIGSGQAAALVVRSLRNDASETRTSPVAVLSDDSADFGRSLLGVPVVGTIEQLPRIAADLGISYALLAAPNASRELVRRAADAAESCGLALKIVPDLAQVLDNVRVTRLMRDVRIEDLLGREQVRTDLLGVARIVAGRRVLITGAGGSIGSEIVRQVAAFGPDTLIALDHDETHLFEVASTVGEHCTQVLADIRDAEVIAEVFATHRPEVVFHAAAHKHVPLLESHPCEAVRTNVVGTLNVLEAARDVGVDRLVFISTDKAVDPSSIMGASKWIGERLVRMHAPTGSRWCAVRFGNVVGSRGSVIPTFTKQIEAGGPVTVTDPAMTRYFMSTEEAVQLVLQASALAEGTEVFMLEMGDPVSILELARKMIRLSGYVPDIDIPIVVTGTRPGEKLTESLAWNEESTTRTAHDSITRLESTEVNGPELADAVVKLQALAVARDESAAAALLVAFPKQAMLAARPDIEDSWSPATT